MLLHFNLTVIFNLLERQGHQFKIILPRGLKVKKFGAIEFKCYIWKLTKYILRAQSRTEDML
jgi:hypothetical protein